MTPNFSAAKTAAVLLAALFVFAAPAFADEAANLAKQLAELRADVETMSNELDLKQRGLKNELDSLAMQKAELEIQVRKEEMRLQNLHASLERQKESLKRDSVSGDELKPLVLHAIAELRTYIKNALPFRVPERLAELDRVESQVHADTLRPARAATMLWALSKTNSGSPGSRASTGRSSPSTGKNNSPTSPASA
ncbi:MAG: DUF3450 domain-containing protein [Deltaproteobacteria bacterium]|nr:DUF3450 domain-containing protein [Deltaproteobacteria bacterium]